MTNLNDHGIQCDDEQPQTDPQTETPAMPRGVAFFKNIARNTQYFADAEAAPANRDGAKETE